MVTTETESPSSPGPAEQAPGTRGAGVAPKAGPGGLTPLPEGVGGFSMAWYPVAMSDEVGPRDVVGRELFDGKVVVFRDGSGRAVVVSAFCRHLGADLSDGDVTDGCLRCPYHHWSYDETGRCVSTASGDRVPGTRRLFVFPTEERWGLVWAFNGTEPTFDVPGWPAPEEEERHVTVRFLLDFGADPFQVPLNGVDLQHIRTLHDIHMDDFDLHEEIDGLHADETGGEPDGRYAPMTRHATFGTNTVVYSRTSTGIDTMIAGAPYRGRTRLYFVIGLVRSMFDEGSLDAVAAGHHEVAAGVAQEDAPIWDKIRFAADTLTASDRLMAVYLRWFNRFPRAHPSQPFVRQRPPDDPDRAQAARLPVNFS